jgi:hypothetical protein
MVGRASDWTEDKNCDCVKGKGGTEKFGFTRIFSD